MNTTNSAPVTLIVCEQAGAWASAIRRLFSPVVIRPRREAPSDDDFPVDGPAAAVIDPPAPAMAAGHGQAVASSVEIPYRLVESRTVEQCLMDLTAAPAALVVVELAEATRERGLELLSAIAEQYPFAKVVVVADRSLRHYEWLTRELGAIHFIASPRQLASLRTIASRHGERTALRTPAASGAGRTTDEIWRSLPWG